MIELEHHQLLLRYASLRIQDPAREARLAGALARDGQLSPVLVISTEGKYLLIDGYARVAALIRLGRDTVRAVELGLTECQALALQHRLENSRERSALEDGWLIRILLTEHGLDREAVSTSLQRSASWVSRRLALVETLPSSVQKAVQRGSLGAHGAARYLVPLARANSEDCAALVKNLPRRVSSRELRELYLAYQSGDRKVRDRVVTHPELLLQVTREKLPEVPLDQDEGLIKDLRMSSGILRRATKRAEASLRQTKEPWCEALRQAFLELKVVYRNLTHQIQEGKNRA